jgi:hypothetical protein
VTTRAQPVDQVHRFSEIPPEILYVPIECRKRILGGRSTWAVDGRSAIGRSDAVGLFRIALVGAERNRTKGYSTQRS